MKCPKCEQEIDKVIFVEENSQEGFLNGSEVYDYGEPYGVEILDVLCPECNEDIADSVIY